MSFADLKRAARQAVHATFAVPAFYTDDFVTGVAVNVRWHNRLIRAGNLEAAGYAEVFEGVNKLIFARAELYTLGLELHQQGIVTIPSYGPLRLLLDTLDPGDGPVTVIWNVARADL